MTRLFDALKKAEASRQVPPPATAAVNPMAPAPPAPVHAGPRAPLRAHEPWRFALPLLGGVPMNEEVVREMMALRVSLDVTLRDRAPKIVMFTSPQGGEGTSTVALQFVQGLARDPGLRPLLVDANVRRPAYEEDPATRCARPAPRLLEGSPEQPVVAANLFVAPVPDEQRQSGLYHAVSFRALLEQASSHHDWIVVDGPPVLDSPDTAALASIADGVVLVVQAGRSKRPVLARAADVLRKSGAQVFGSVLNRRVLEIPEFIYRRI